MEPIQQKEGSKIKEVDVDDMKDAIVLIGATYRLRSILNNPELDTRDSHYEKIGDWLHELDGEAKHAAAKIGLTEHDVYWLWYKIYEATEFETHFQYPGAPIAKPEDYEVEDCRICAYCDGYFRLQKGVRD